jgi:hypothetical protein
MASLIDLALESVKYVVAKIEQARSNHEDIKELAAHMESLEPILQAVRDQPSSASRLAASGVFEPLRRCLEEAGVLVDDVSDMHKLSFFVRSGLIADKLERIRCGIKNFLGSAALLNLHVSNETRADIKALAEDLDSWKIVQQREFDMIKGLLAQQQHLAQAQHLSLQEQQRMQQQQLSQITVLLGKLLESSGRAPPQMMAEIDSAMQAPEALRLDEPEERVRRAAALPAAHG